MLATREIAFFLRKLARYRGLSDGAKVTLLEFLPAFWTDDKKIPSYSELEEYRAVARSSIQLHVEELELCGVLTSIRLPDNRKRYKLNLDALDASKKIVKKGRQEIRRSLLHKHTATFETDELCEYFLFHASELAGVEKASHCKREFYCMKDVQKRHGASAVVKAIDYFKRIHQRRKVPFNIETFCKEIETLVGRE